MNQPPNMSDAPINPNTSDSKPKAVDSTRSMMQNYLNLLRATKPDQEDSASQLDQSTSTEFQSQGLLVVARGDSGSNTSNSDESTESIGVGQGTHGNLNQAKLSEDYLVSFSSGLDGSAYDSFLEDPFYTGPMEEEVLNDDFSVPEQPQDLDLVYWLFGPMVGELEFPTHAQLLLTN